jgi:cytochrome c2
MKRRTVTIGLAVLLLSGGGLQKGTAIERTNLLSGDPKEGHKLFEQKRCIMCHTVRGEGGAVGPDLSVSSKLRLSLTQIAGVMWNHAPAMKYVMEERGIPRPTFKGTEMADLIAYLISDQHLDDSGDPTNGRQLFYSKGCFICHAINGEGGKVGSDLSKIRHLDSPILMVQIMWNHAPQMEILMENKQMPWPIFKGNEMVDLLAYIRSQNQVGP